MLPTLVHRLLPTFGQHLFALAIVSASLSTASALLHIASGSLGRDVFKKHLTGWSWRGVVIICTVCSGLFALKSSSIIALICATSWTLLACAILVPYLALLIPGPKAGSSAALMSSLGGLAGTAAWYLLAYRSTSMGITGLSAPGIIGAIHPILPGVAASFISFAMFAKKGTFRVREESKLPAGGLQEQ